MEWQTADWPHECDIALRSTQMPRKEPGQKCLSNLTMVNVMNTSARLLRRLQNNTVLCVQCQDPQRPLSFSVRANMSWRAYLEIYSLSRSHVENCNLLFLPSCAHAAQPFITKPHLHPICQRYRPSSGFWKVIFCLWIPIYQPVCAYMGALWYSTWGSNSMHGCAFNIWIKSRKQLRMQIKKRTVTCMFYYTPTNSINCCELYENSSVSRVCLCRCVAVCVCERGNCYACGVLRCNAHACEINDFTGK